jgi:hypothetical protein
MFIGASPFGLILVDQNQFIGGAPIFLSPCFQFHTKKFTLPDYWLKVSKQKKEERQGQKLPCLSEFPF